MHRQMIASETAGLASSEKEKLSSALAYVKSVARVHAYGYRRRHAIGSRRKRFYEGYPIGLDIRKASKKIRITAHLGTIDEPFQTNALNKRFFKTTEFLYKMNSMRLNLRDQWAQLTDEARQNFIAGLDEIERIEPGAAQSVSLIKANIIEKPAWQ